MFIIVLVGAFILYVGLYFAWASLQPHLTQHLSTLDLFMQMIFVPQHTVFFILRTLIVITAVYTVADFFYSSGRRAMRRPKRSSSSNQQVKS